MALTCRTPTCHIEPSRWRGTRIATMTRAGKEPAEDVKRAIRRAVELAGLEVRGVRMSKSPGLDVRLVLGWASPVGWPHKLPAIELNAVVGFDGTVGDIEIRCAATDDDPLMNTFIAPHVQRCKCRLPDYRRHSRRCGWLAAKSLQDSGRAKQGRSSTASGTGRYRTSHRCQASCRSLPSLRVCNVWMFR